jgi:hypothetical protein
MPMEIFVPVDTLVATSVWTSKFFCGIFFIFLVGAGAAHLAQGGDSFIYWRVGGEEAAK